MIWVVYYAILDPFKVIKHYDLYYQPDEIIGINRGFASTMHYNNHKDEYHYDDMVFMCLKSDREFLEAYNILQDLFHYHQKGASMPDNSGVLKKVKFCITVWLICKNNNCITSFTFFYDAASHLITKRNTIMILLFLAILEVPLIMKMSGKSIFLRQVFAIILTHQEVLLEACTIR